MIRYLALALALGGWVCNRDGDNPCTGANTCDTDIGVACCPLGVASWCGGCHADVGECSEHAYSCRDESTILDCSFDALVMATTCEAGNENGMPVWHVVANGTLSGCGGETVLFVVGDQLVTSGFDCGAWTPGLFGGCVPDADATSQTTYAIDTIVPASANNAVFALVRAHGDTPPIAAAALTCQ